MSLNPHEEVFSRISDFAFLIFNLSVTSYSKGRKELMFKDEIE